MVAYNENAYFQVFYHMKLLRNIVPKFPLLEVSQDILKLAIFFPEPSSLWDFSLKQYIVPALAFLLKLKY